MLPDLLNYESTEPSIWQGRKDSRPGERFFQHVTVLDLTQQRLRQTRGETVITGFCSDEGIKRNAGRVGAKDGPLQLREQLARLACHSDQQFIDIGNIIATDKLEAAQEQFARLIDHCHQQGYKTVALGGGHEIAWPHFRGLAPHYSNLGIINFDAHFDLRPLKKGHYATSGTPFRQIADYCLQHQFVFNYCCLGIQRIANTESLFASAHESGVAYLYAEQIHEKSLAWQTDFLDNFISNHEFIYLSLCLDVFAECFAPGVSAPQATGLTPWQVIPLLKYILQTGKVVGFDIAELSPPLDEGHKTARLAASLMAELLTYY
ncbi:formimidoylglutamase [Legionella fairfieldensis]|uniref:formimidoylglutamase n=1 Tax=Legionella fairfieldensis TaxID=45064 RepID=UPI000491D54C|nr:formimidoylglutamase [Legionella fairfieldensis]